MVPSAPRHLVAPLSALAHAAALTAVEAEHSTFTPTTSDSRRAIVVGGRSEFNDGNDGLFTSSLSNGTLVDSSSSSSNNSHDSSITNSGLIGSSSSSSGRPGSGSNHLNSSSSSRSSSSGRPVSGSSRPNSSSSSRSSSSSSGRPDSGSSRPNSSSSSSSSSFFSSWIYSWCAWYLPLTANLLGVEAPDLELATPSTDAPSTKATYFRCRSGLGGNAAPDNACVYMSVCV
jgi:hypothetical protein